MYKVNPSELEKIEQFVIQHQVEYKELQIELTDHLANEIENILTKNDKVEFQDALKESYLKFGKKGFYGIKEQREKEFEKKYTLWLLRSYMDFFKWPQILFFMFVFSPTYAISQQVSLDTFYIIVQVSVITMQFISFVSLYIRKNKIVKEKWLLYDLGIKSGFGFNLINPLGEIKLFDF